MNHCAAISGSRFRRSSEFSWNWCLSNAHSHLEPNHSPYRKYCASNANRYDKKKPGRTQTINRLRCVVNHNGARLFTCLFPIAYNIKIKLTFQPNDQLQMAHDSIARNGCLLSAMTKLKSNERDEKKNCNAEKKPANSLIGWCCVCLS